MLQEFRVDNFKSLINIVFVPATTNLLLGMNNSGKTNLLVASDGGNLASVLYWLKTGDERAYRRLLKVTRTIEPSLDLINFRTGSEDHVFMYDRDTRGDAKGRVCRYVLQASLRVWIRGSRSFRDFYDEARGWAARNGCPLPNELEA